MPVVIDEPLVRRIAHLSRLALTDAEVAEYSGQLGRIVTYIDLLSECPTEGVAPFTSAVSSLTNIRPDEPLACLTQTAALANAPDCANECFRVPAVLDGGDGA